MCRGCGSGCYGIASQRDDGLTVSQIEVPDWIHEIEDDVELCRQAHARREPMDEAAAIERSQFAIELRNRGYEPALAIGEGKLVPYFRDR